MAEALEGERRCLTEEEEGLSDDTAGGLEGKRRCLTPEEEGLYVGSDGYKSFDKKTVLGVRVTGQGCEDLGRRIYTNVPGGPHAEETFLRDVQKLQEGGATIEGIEMFINFSPCYACAPELQTKLAGIATTITFSRGHYTKLTKFLKEERPIVKVRGGEQRDVRAVVKDSLQNLYKLGAAVGFTLNPTVPQDMLKEGDDLIKHTEAKWKEMLAPFCKAKKDTLDRITAGMGQMGIGPAEKKG